MITCSAGHYFWPHHWTARLHVGDEVTFELGKIDPTALQDFEFGRNFHGNCIDAFDAAENSFVCLCELRALSLKML